MRWLLYISFFYTSCTHQVQFSKTLSPEILLPSGNQQILFVSRFDTSMVAFTDMGDALTVNRSFKELTAGLEAGFSGIPHINYLPADSVIKGQWFRHTENINFVDSLKLRAIHKRYPQAYLLTLDLFSPGMEYLDVVNLGEGFEIRAYDIFVEAAFTLYDPQGNVFDQIIVESADQVRHRQMGGGLVVHHPSFKEFEEKAEFLSEDLGKSYAELFIPIQQEVTRSYFNGKELNEAASLMSQKQWEPARDLLLPLTQHEDPKIAEKAVYNLLVVYEAMGNFEAEEQLLNKIK